VDPLVHHVSNPLNKMIRNTKIVHDYEITKLYFIRQRPPFAAEEELSFEVSGSKQYEQMLQHANERHRTLELA